MDGGEAHAGPRKRTLGLAEDGRPAAGATPARWPARCSSWTSPTRPLSKPSPPPTLPHQASVSVTVTIQGDQESRSGVFWPEPTDEPRPACVRLSGSACWTRSPIRGQRFVYCLYLRFLVRRLRRPAKGGETVGLYRLAARTSASPLAYLPDRFLTRKKDPILCSTATAPASASVIRPLHRRAPRGAGPVWPRRSEVKDGAVSHGLDRDGRPPRRSRHPRRWTGATRTGCCSSG